MHCKTTLEQLAEWLRESDSSLDQSCRRLRDHVQHCGHCRTRLDRLTDEPVLARAAQRGYARINQPDSPVLWRTLEAVETLRTHTPALAEHDTTADSNPHGLSSLLDPPQQSSDLGTVGRYQVQAVLGRGGMSVVFAAWDGVLERRVAIKVFSTHEDEPTWKRFVREARAAARIEHSAVIPVYEVIERPGKPPALVMPLMSGGTLQEHIGRQTLSPRRAAEITACIADGLSEVHRHGQIHRDVKPGNILFDDDGQARLADFSLVRRSEDEPLTEADVLPGTPEFIAPEMLLGTGAAGPASDTYQLGLTLYIMLSGVCPYQGTVNSVLAQIIEGPPPDPSKHARGIPKDLETICLKAIERQPSDRYSTAGDLAADLQRYLAGEPIAARRPNLVSHLRRWTKRHPVTTAITGIALPCLIALGVGYAAYQEQSERLDHQAQLYRAQQDTQREELAEQTHRAEVAELKSEQMLSQTLTAVFAAKQVREPDWVDTEKMLLKALLGGLEQNFEQMLIDPKRNANFGEIALSVAKLRCRVDRSADALESFQHAIDDFDRRLKQQPTEQLWQLLTDAHRSKGAACRKLGQIGLATTHLEKASAIARGQSRVHPESLKWKLESAMSQTKYGHTLLDGEDVQRAEACFDDAADRIDTIVQADGPRFNLNGFRELFADAIANLAGGYRRLKHFDEATRLQQLASAQNDQLGKDELSRVRQADCRAELSEILADAGRPSEAAAQLRRALESIEDAISSSGQPQRYNKRRHQWQRRVAMLDVSVARQAKREVSNTQPDAPADNADSHAGQKSN